MIGWQGWRSRRGRQSAGRQWAALANSAMQGRRAPDPDLRDEALALHADLRRFLQHSDASPSRARDDLQLLDLPPGTDFSGEESFECAIRRRPPHRTLRKHPGNPS